MMERPSPEEVKVGEARAPYIVGQETEEETLERIRIQFPPYFERFLDERDRRFSAELRRIEDAVEQVRRDVAQVSRELDFRFNILAELYRSLDAKVDRLAEELRAEMDRRFAEAADERQAIRREMREGFNALRAEMQEGLGALRAEMDHRFAQVAEEQKSLRAEMERRFAQVAEEQKSLRAEMDRRFAQVAEEQKSLRAEMDRRFAELAEEQKALRSEMRSHFRWTMGLLFPLVISVVAMLIQMFLIGAP